MGRGGSALVVGLVLTALAACTSEQESPEPPTEPVVTELEELEARIWGEPDPLTGDPRLREAEEAIAACMADAGFEYHPQVPAEQHRFPSPAVLTREHATAHGYGQTIAPAPGVPPQAWAYQPGPVPGEQENLDYRVQLPLDAEEAYWAALHGDVSPEAADGVGPTDLGCRGKVMAEVYADVMVPEAFRAAETAVRQVRHTIEREADVVAAVGRWGGCMADAGYPGLEGRRDGQDAVVGRVDVFPAPTGMPFEQVAEVYPAELAEIQEYERALAVADATCLEATGFYAVWDAARTRLHARVVASHRKDLEAWAAWAEERRAGRP